MGEPIVIYPEPGDNAFNACQNQLGDLYAMCGTTGDGGIICCPVW
jgi:hypothetical protein